MYAFIEGRVAEKNAGELVLEANGVGYQLLCSTSTLAAVPADGERVRVYTHFSVREDAMELFGFATREERGMFQKLCGISGIGPRTALGILSSMAVRDLTIALLTGDAAALARAPGIGKKTAQRMILELRDKVEQQEVNLGAALPASVAAQDALEEAVAALQSLGYNAAEAQQAVLRVKDESDRADQLILLALRQIGAE